MGRELMSKNGKDKHTAVVEELFSPYSWKHQWWTKFSRLEEDYFFAGEV